MSSETHWNKFKIIFKNDNSEEKTLKGRAEYDTSYSINSDTYVQTGPHPTHFVKVAVKDWN